VRQVRLPIAIPAAPPPRASGPARVVFVGRLGAQKGVDVLLRSARHFDAHIDVIGDGWARPRLERLTRRLRLDERVTFHGWCDAATISQAYANARAAVVPSTWPEPFGMVGPEAMVHARPVVASSTGGVSDWLTDAEAGYLVPPGDPRALGEAIARLLASPARAHEMGLAGRRLVADRFTDSAHVRDLLPVYTSVLLDEGATPRA
jgi:glycosyltransferase involved in cell wall biosynthesis